jgi:hypothetical protein
MHSEDRETAGTSQGKGYVGAIQLRIAALVHLCTCKAAANRSNVYVSGKK